MCLVLLLNVVNNLQNGNVDNLNDNLFRSCGILILSEMLRMLLNFLHYAVLDGIPHPNLSCIFYVFYTPVYWILLPHLIWCFCDVSRDFGKDSKKKSLILYDLASRLQGFSIFRIVFLKPFLQISLWQLF